MMANDKTPENEGSAAERYDDFDEFLRSEGLEAKVKDAVEKRIIAVQLERRRIETGMSKAELARRLGTSRTQVDRILDPRSRNVTLETLSKVATIMGKRLHLELID